MYVSNRTVLDRIDFRSTTKERNVYKFETIWEWENYDRNVIFG